MLDEKRPDWFLHVDPDQIDLLSPQNCVLGQVYGRHIVGMRDLGIKSQAYYGFLPEYSGRSRKRAWRKAIETRLAKAVAAGEPRLVVAGPESR